MIFESDSVKIFPAINVALHMIHTLTSDVRHHAMWENIRWESKAAKYGMKTTI